MLHLSCIDNYEQFAKNKDEINNFMNTYFPKLFPRSFCWLEAWWHTYQPNKKVRIYIVRKTNPNKTIAIIPLFLASAKLGGFPVKKIEILGRGIGNEDLAIRSYLSECLDLVFSNLSKSETWHIAQFSRIANPDLKSALCKIAQQKKLRTDQIAAKNLRIDLNGKFEDYFKSRSKKFRQNLRTAKNRISKEGSITFSHFILKKSDPTPLNMGKKIAVESWQYAEESSHFNDHSGKNFYQNITNSCSNTPGEFWFINLEDNPIAYLFAVPEGRIFNVIDVAFIEKYKKYSPGRILYCHVIEKIFSERDFQFFDFGGGSGYKEEYSNVELDETTVTIYNRTAYSLFVNFIRRSGLYKKIKNALN